MPEISIALQEHNLALRLALALGKMITVSAPIKGEASIQKLFFDPLHYGVFHRKFCIFNTQGRTRTKFDKTHLYGQFQRVRPLLVRVR